MNGELIEGEDFSYDECGKMILSRKFLLRRGHCCKSGCFNCPYEEGKALDPSVPLELEGIGEENELSKYLDDEYIKDFESSN